MDGHAINDNIFDQAPIGTDFPVDIDLINRVEIIRGPNSSLYLANALLAVINVITEPVRTSTGLEASAELASWGTFKTRLTYGHQFINGLEMLLSATYYNSQGHETLYFPEFDTPATHYGVASNLDGNVSEQIFTNFSYRNFRLEALYESWEKKIPTASYGSLFNASPNYQVETAEYVDLQYNRHFGSDWGLMGQAYYDRYPIDIMGAYDLSALGLPGISVNRTQTRGQLWGAELAGSKKLLGRQTLIVGAEFRDNFQQDQVNYIVHPFISLLNDHEQSTISGLYAQDEVRLRHDLVLNLGVRYDHYSTFGGTTNPRAALIYSPAERTTLKLLYGQSFRAPNDYELYFQSGNLPNSPQANPNLRPETARTTELVLDEVLGRQVHLLVSGYYYQIRGLISETTQPATAALVYENSQRDDLKGTEITLEKQSRSGLQGGVSFSLQDAKDTSTGLPLANSPRELGQANLSLPLFHRKLFASGNLTAVSPRKTLAGHDAAGYLLPNFTLFSTAFKRCDVSFSLYNAFNHHYSDPAGPQLLQDLIPQDGLTFRLKFAYRF